MKYSVTSILANEKNEFLFFWGHQPSKTGEITKSCLSQWWEAPFTEDGFVYPTAEHYMMAQKALLFGDQEIFQRILEKTSPKDVKDLGRQIQHFDSAAWDSRKYEFVRQGNYLKFSQNEDLKHFLLQTKGKVLVEASPVDAIWGIGLAEDDSKATNPAQWRGENLLGFALMEVRDLIK